MKEVQNDRIKKAYETLVDSYARSVHRKKFDLIERAFKFATHAHRNIKRDSGDPYILHPLAVALIASEEIGLGSTSICSALLHDVVEDTECTIEEIKNLFGEKIAKIVDGLTKISGGDFSETPSMEAENMRRLLLTMASDIRVILVKIADRLHNMRTLEFLLPIKQYQIAWETLYLYAPMAHRLGLFSIKTELEDLSFFYEYPIEYRQIERQLAVINKNWEKIYKQFIIPIKKSLDFLDYQYKIQGRAKSIYSIWSKMQSKKINFVDIYDIFAVRIIFNPKSDQAAKKQCWDIYSLITDLYQPRPDRLRDWISHPKANGYQSLHLTVMGPYGQWVEVQIRSFSMNEIAEKGLAAHWRYKKQGNDFISGQNELDLWLEKIQDILRNPTPDAMDFLDTIKLNLYSNEIFIFTPKGEIKILPQESTVLDFAYEIHSQVGSRCIGAKVNHKLVPIGHKLISGDQIEILTSFSQKPQKEWLSFVITANAKTKIELALRKQQKIEIQEGELMLNRYLANSGIKLTTQMLDKLCSYYGYSRKELLFSALVAKQIQLSENLYTFLKTKTNRLLIQYVKKVFNAIIPSKGILDSNKFSIKNLLKTSRENAYLLDENRFRQDYITYPCCNPIPGDKVFGIIRDDGKLEVHKELCKTFFTFKTHFSNRLIFCSWVGHKSFSFLVSIELKGIDKVGILNEITQVITCHLSFHIHRLSVVSKEGIIDGTIEIVIRNTEDIQIICTKLRKIVGIKNVHRTS